MGHVNFSRAARILVDYHTEWWAAFFIIYRIFVSFAVLQVIRSVFIATTQQVAARANGSGVDVSLKAKHEDEEKLIACCRLMHKGHAILDQPTFMAGVQKEEVKELLEELHIDMSDAQMCFELLDLDGDGFITEREFVIGSGKLRGVAQGVALYTLESHVTKMDRKVEAILHLLEVK